MQWVYFASKPLTLQGLGIAMAIDSNIEHRKIAQGRESEKNAKSRCAMRNLILNLFQGLVKFVKHDDMSVAQCIRHSINGYLYSRGFQLLGLSNDWEPDGRQNDRSPPILSLTVLLQITPYERDTTL